MWLILDKGCMEVSLLPSVEIDAERDGIGEGSRYNPRLIELFGTAAAKPGHFDEQAIKRSASFAVGRKSRRPMAPPPSMLQARNI